MIDTSLMIVMIVGIIFYALLIIFYFLGKNKRNNTGGQQSIGVGKFNIRASEFIILALVSAVFVVSPFVYDYFNKECPPTPVKEDRHDFVIRGRAEDDNKKGQKNIFITAKQYRDGQVLLVRKDSTDIEGSYEFKFNNAHPDDKFEITWTAPDNTPKRKMFGFNEVTFPITITFQSN